jgi:hypothetical protein
LSVTWKRLAVPLKDEVPVNVAVPADAAKVPLTVSPEAIVKFEVVVIEPDTESMLMLMAPAPEIVLDVPLMVIVPVLAAKLPLTERLPVSVNDDVVVTEPLTVRLSSEIPEPEIVLVAPDMINVPAWLNEPAPVVSRLPVRVMVEAEKLTNAAATVRLLKF